MDPIDLNSSKAKIFRSPNHEFIKGQNNLLNITPGRNPILTQNGQNSHSRSIDKKYQSNDSSSMNHVFNWSDSLRLNNVKRHKIDLTDVFKSNPKPIEEIPAAGIKTPGLSDLPTPS